MGRWAQAELMGTAARRWLDEARGTASGRVHSAFSRAINLLFPGDRFLAVIQGRRGLLPRGIALGGDGGRDLRKEGLLPGGRAELRGELLLVGGGLEVRLSGADVWIPPQPERVPCLEPPLLGGRIVQMRAELRRWEEGLALQPIPFAKGIVASDHPALLLSAFIRGEEGIRGAIRRLAGWGPGLTPSGDDLLAGFLLSVRWGEVARGRPLSIPWQRLRQLVLEEALPRTTFFGRELLALASCGEGPYGALGLLAALYSAEGDGLLLRARSLLSLGATSGADLVAGIICGAEAVMAEERPSWISPS